MLKLYHVIINYASFFCIFYKNNHFFLFVSETTYFISIFVYNRNVANFYYEPDKFCFKKVSKNFSNPEHFGKIEARIRQK